jgi:hypothetical protein
VIKTKGGSRNHRGDHVIKTTRESRTFSRYKREGQREREGARGSECEREGVCVTHSPLWSESEGSAVVRERGRVREGETEREKGRERECERERERVRE